MYNDLPVIRSTTLFIPRLITGKNANNPSSFLGHVGKLYGKYISEFEEFLREKGLTIWTIEVIPHQCMMCGGNMEVE